MTRSPKIKQELKRRQRKFQYKKFFLLPLFCAGVFGFQAKALAEYQSVIINELMWMGSSISTADEFIELKNTTNHAVDISAWKIKRLLGGEEVEMITISENTILGALDYFLVSNYGAEKSFINVKPDREDTKVSLANEKLQISLYDADGTLIDAADDGSGKPVAGENESVKKSMERNEEPGSGEEKKNWHSCFAAVNLDAGAVECATPKAENSQELAAPKEEAKSYSDEIRLNEIFPNPTGEEKTEEYIEIYNPAKADADLSGWTLKDSSKTGKYILPELTVVGAEDFLIFYRPEFKFALNNSGTETVYLLDPNEKNVSSVEYAKSQAGTSYNFDGAKWRWSKFLTPGAENKFNNLPAVAVMIEKEIYKDVYADFEVGVSDPDQDIVKVTWSFGDGRKSYKQKTRHKYAATGKYDGNVRIFDGSEEVVEVFVIKVEDFPTPKVRIISLMPNPPGEDSGNEWIMVKNKSKKEVNLKDWSVATGRNSKKLTNHPIKEALVIKAGKTEKITREISKFTLHNKKARVELRYPDGEMAHRAKYKREDGIKEGEIYAKIHESGWQWTEEQETVVAAAEIEPEQEAAVMKIPEKESSSDAAEILEEEEEEFPADLLGKQSGEKKGEGLKVTVVEYQVNKKIAGYLTTGTGKVLGAAIVNEEGVRYFFIDTSRYSQPDHYASKFFKRLWQRINATANKIILK